MSIAFLSRHEHSVRNLSENTDRVGSKIVIVVIIIIILNHQTGICRREWDLIKDWDIANVTNVTLNIKNLTCGDISTPCSWFENLHCFSEDCSIGKAAARCWDLKSILSKPTTTSSSPWIGPSLFWPAELLLGEKPEKQRLDISFWYLARWRWILFCIN